MRSLLEWVLDLVDPYVDTAWWPVISVVSLGLSTLFFVPVFGWRAATLIGLGTFVHEMGHYLVLRMFGVQCIAPLFLVLRAFVPTYDYELRPHKQAWIAAAGPLAGMFFLFGLLILSDVSPLWAPHIFFAVFLLALDSVLNVIPLPGRDGWTLWKVITTGAYQPGGTKASSHWSGLRTPTFLLWQEQKHKESMIIRVAWAIHQVLQIVYGIYLMYMSVTLAHQGNVWLFWPGVL